MRCVGPHGIAQKADPGRSAEAGKEALGASVVACCTNKAHGFSHGMPGQRRDVLSASKLASAIGMQDAPGNVTAAGGSTDLSVDCNVVLHACANQVSDDPSGEHILHRTDIGLPFQSAALRNVAEPQLVGLGIGESPVHEILLHRCG